MSESNKERMQRESKENREARSGVKRINHAVIAAQVQAEMEASARAAELGRLGGLSKSPAKLKALAITRNPKARAGRTGGSVRSAAKAVSSRANGKLGGRPPRKAKP